MLANRQDSPLSPSLEPRARIEGLEVLPPEIELPSLDVVRSEAEKLHKMKIDGLMRVHSFRFDGGSFSKAPGPLPEPLVWNALFPKLFYFSFYAAVEDVPADLLEDVIFVLKMFVRTLTESTEEQLRDIGHYLPGQDAEDANYCMLFNARGKLIQHLMNNRIDRPDEALPHLEAAVQEQVRRLTQKRGSHEDTVESNPNLYCIYGSALTFTGHFDKKTKEMLESVLKAAMHSPLASTVDFSGAIVKTHINLSLVLKQMNVEPMKQIEHTEWAVKWLRKNSKRMDDLEQYVKRSNQPPHPVYTALGAAWFKANTETTKRDDDREAKQCWTCNRLEPQVKLFRCAGCQYLFYCSKECQKSNWKFHKESCKDRAYSIAQVQKLKNVGEGMGANKAAEWIKWRDGSQFANTYALAHALGLTRDPSRGRTHIVFRLMEYTPKASKDIRYRFRVSHAGVFKLADVYTDIERVMALKPGEGKEYVDSLLDELDAQKSMEQVPMLHLSFGGGVQAWLGRRSLRVHALRLLTYDPNWRQSINPASAPAGPLHASAEDVEHIF